MKKSIHIVQLALLGALLIQTPGCTTSKSLMKDGYAYSDAGMHQEAVNSFKQSLERKYQNVESRKGLKVSGQQVLNAMLTDFDVADQNGVKREAVYAFRACTEFVAEAKEFGVDLTIGSAYFDRYSDNEGLYLAGLYSDGMTLLEQEDFKSAKLRFDEILLLAPGYKDVSDLQEMSVLEPKYRRANQLMGEGYFRDAYWEYQAISSQDASYRDVTTRSMEAMEKGQFVLAMLPFENSSFEPFVEHRIEAYTLNSLINLNNPFLRVVDRHNLDLIFAEQDFSTSGAINDATAVEVGNLTGADAIMIGQVIDFRVEQGRGRRVPVDAFEKYEVTVRGEDGKESTEIRYHPVTYYEYINSNSVYVSFLLKMLDIETSEVLVSEVFEQQFGDAVHWAEFERDFKNLVPVDNEGEPCTDRGPVNDFRNLFEKRRELMSIDQIINDSYREVANSVAYRVDDYLR